MDSVLTNLFRTLMFFFDNIIYGFIPTVYSLLLYLAQIDIFSTDSNIAQLMNQIYTLLGIFMLFKLAFSFLRYIIDPEAMSDNAKGVGKLITNTIVVVVLLVTVPYIFNIAYKFQYAIVTSNVLGQIILGANTGGSNVDVDDIGNLFDVNNPQYTVSTETSDILNKNAKDLQFLMFGAFYSVNYDVIPECGDPDNGVMPTPIFGSIEMAQNAKCLDALEGYFESEADISTNGVTLGSFFKGIDGNGQTIDERNFSHFDKLLWWKIDGEYAINYLPLISTAAGIYVIILLILFCADVAVRAIKLCFLQMIAPIPIISHIDPGSSSENDKLNKWAHECWNTYLSLFIRLATIFLIMRFISLIASGVFDNDGFKNNITANEYTMWVYLFLVIGAFLFAKEVPKLLESVLNIKSSGDLHLKTPAAIMGAGALAGVTGGLANTINAVKTNNWSKGHRLDSFGKTIGSSLTGAASAGFRGAFMGRKGNVLQSATAGRQEMIKSRNLKADNYGYGDRVQAAVNKFAGARGKTGTESGISDQIKQFTALRDDAQLREDQHNEVMGDIRKENPKYGKQLRDAFETRIVTEDGTPNGNPVFNENGAPVYKRTYSNYEAYVKAKHVGELVESGQMTKEQAENHVNRHPDLSLNWAKNHEDTVLPRKLYDQYEVEFNAKEEANNDVQRYSQRIDKLEGAKKSIEGGKSSLGSKPSSGKGGDK